MLPEGLCLLNQYGKIELCNSLSENDGNQRTDIHEKEFSRLLKKPGSFTIILAKVIGTAIRNGEEASACGFRISALLTAVRSA